MRERKRWKERGRETEKRKEKGDRKENKKEKKEREIQIISRNIHKMRALEVK